MAHRRFWTFLFFSLLASVGYGRNIGDTSKNKVLDEVVVTATRTENLVKNLPMPIQVISEKTIKESGSEDLLELLQMQTGVVLAANPMGVSLQGVPNPFGAGIQMQGLDPAYTMILIDGDPVIGRNGGVLDVTRIAVDDIKQIEILRGPATSLYGSDALAGVINIITQSPKKNSIRGKLHYGSNNEMGVNLSGDIKLNKTALKLFVRRFSNDGWDYSKDIYGKTIDPSRNYSIDAKSITTIDDKNKLTFSAKYFHQKVLNDFMVAPVDVPEVINGTTYEIDKSIVGKWDHQVNNKLNYTFKVFTSGYDNHSDAFLKRNDSLYEKITLNQLLVRPELQVNAGKRNNQWVAGTGYSYESVHSNRYSSDKRMDLFYAFLQKQKTFSNAFNVIAGIRLDKHREYATQLSPKIALAYKINPDLIVKGSIGTGFKTPDFRQLYLNYFNSLVGYTILGAHELGNALGQMQQSGRIASDIDITPYIGRKDLKPEKSLGINLGFDYTFTDFGVFKVNLFRNDISNLLETYALPFKQTNNREIFSYKNLNKVYTQGVEVNLNYKIGRNFTINGGYNFLDAKDKQVIKDIKAGKLFKRDPETLKTTQVKLKDYKGLYNRSRHTVVAGLRYDNIKYKSGALLNVKYRGKYGFEGLNEYMDGNTILDDPREFAEGYTLINLILHKEINDHFELQGGINNILNYVQPALMPSQYGRGYFINLNFKF